jgi:hypothetical protein
MMRIKPVPHRDDSHKLPLRLFRRFRVCQSKAVGDALNMRINRERRLPKRVRQYDVRDLAPDARQSGKFAYRIWHFAAVTLYQFSAGCYEVASLCMI